MLEKNVLFSITPSTQRPKGNSVLWSLPQQGGCMLRLSSSTIPCARHCAQTHDFGLWTKGDKLSTREKTAALGVLKEGMSFS